MCLLQRAFCRPFSSLEEQRGVHLAHARADPGAVMVEFPDTVVANSAVGAARRPKMIASRAPLGVHRVSVHLILLGGALQPAE